MTVKVSLEFKSVDEAIVTLGKIALAGVRTSAASVEKAGAGQPGKVPTGVGGLPPAQSTAAEPARKRKPRADKGQKRGGYGPRVQASAAPVQAATPAPESAAPAAAEPVLTVEDVQAWVRKLYVEKDHDATEQALKHFGVSRGQDLAPEKRAEFIVHVKNILGEPA